MVSLLNKIRLLSLLIALPCLCWSVEYTVGSASELSALSPVAGDIITLESGQWINEQLNLSFDGTAGNPIIVRAASPGQTLLLGTSSITIDGDYIEVSGLVFTGEGSTKDTAVTFTSNASNSRLYDTAIVDFNPTAQSGIHTWVNLYGTDNRVDHCLLKGKTHAGQTMRVRRDVDRNDRHLIDHNYFLDRIPLGVNGGETIQIGLSQTQFTDSLTTVENNLFENLDGEIEIISVKSGGNLLRHNTIVECAGLFTLRHGNGSTIDGNFFLCNDKIAAGGVRIYGENHTVINNYIFQADGTSITRGGINIHSGDTATSAENPSGTVAAKNCLIAFNTLVDCQQSISYGNGKVVHPEDITLANNIVYSSSAPLIRVEEDIINPIYEGNLFFGADLGISQPAGITITDPLLQADTNGVYRPTITSPAIDGAIGTYSSVTNDVDGQPRDDGMKDVGADEVSGASPANVPLTPDDVGPSWASYPFVVDTFPVIEDMALEEGRLTEVYSFTLNSLSGDQPLSWSILSGSLPAGLALSTDGTISGIPSVLGSETFTVSVVDADGDSDTHVFSLTVSESFSYYGAFVETAGNVMIEAENFSDSFPLNGKEWVKIFTASATGSNSLNAIQALPDASGITAVGEGTWVDYNVELSLGGSYYIHVLGRGANTSSDSVYVSMNRSVSQAQTIYLPSPDFGWKRSSSPYALTTGSYKISIWMREAGSIVDRVFLSTSADAPSGSGGTESARNLDLFEVWRSHHFGDLTPDYSDDSDDDGFSLLMEYALGSDPKSSLFAGEKPTLTIESSGVNYSFPRDAALADIVYRVLSSEDLMTSWDSTLYDSALDLSPNNAADRMEITAPLSESGRLFLMLEVELK